LSRFPAEDVPGNLNRDLHWRATWQHFSFWRSAAVSKTSRSAWINKTDWDLMDLLRLVGTT
jgi:hypothetical protein